MPRDGWDVKRRRSRRAPDTVVVRVPESQMPLLHLRGQHGGALITLLWNFGVNVEISWDDNLTTVRTRGLRVRLAQTSLVEVLARFAQVIRTTECTCCQPNEGLIKVRCAHDIQ